MTGIVADDGRAHPLVRQMFGIMRRQRTNTTELADAVGMARRTTHFWREGHGPTLGLFEACLHELGYELRIVERQ